MAAELHLEAPIDLRIDGAPELVFQPAVDLATGRLLGFESLLRWKADGQAPDYVPPTELIAWAEANGHMAALDAWILAEACAQASRWGSGHQITVNCSTGQLRRRAVAETLAAALHRSGLTPDRLIMEITHAATTDGAATAEVQAIAALGVQLAIDDIGPEMSILSDLEHLAVGTIKLDGPLVAGLEAPDGTSRSQIEALVNVSRSLRICTVAECVETAEQVAALRDLQVDVAQGYFFSPPVSGDDAVVLSSAGAAPTYSLRMPREFVSW
jgi:EAL domain-containing protein (putative c-di-GMP-specific phosphodiesterase class I)